jgi:SOS-response transcriptional repressor LexA
MTTLKGIGKVIRKLRKERGWTIDQLARKIGKSKTYISLIENSIRRLNTSLIEDFARAFDVQPTHILIESFVHSMGDPGEDIPVEKGQTCESDLVRELKAVVDKHTNPESAQVIELRRIPIISSSAAGEPVYYEDAHPIGYADEFVECPAEIDDPNAFALKIRGDSMEERIHDGDVVIVCPNWEVKENKPVVAKVDDGEITCKLYNRQGDTIILTAVNPSYPPQVYHASKVQWVYPVAKLISTVY